MARRASGGLIKAITFAIPLEKEIKMCFNSVS
jgi:hypothetical protein